MRGSGGSGKVPEGPGIPKGRKSQPEVSELRGLLGVPEGSYRILTTLKGMWRILEGGELLSGP